MLSIVPLIVLWLDLMYGCLLNINASVVAARQTWPPQGLPVSPDIAFNWLQVITNGLMVLLISYVFMILIRFNWYVLHDKFWPITLRRLFALCIILAFSLPSWWQWGLAIKDMLEGRPVIDWHNKRYLVVALMMPYPAALCLWLLWRRRWRRPAEPVVTEVGEPETPLITANSQLKSWY